MADAQTALLAGIIANPEDNGRRLIYADWLDEFGDPLRGCHEQAQYIRLAIDSEQYQCSNASAATGCPRCSLRNQADKLYAAGHVGWYAESMEALRHCARPSTSRGFINGVEAKSVVPHAVGHVLVTHHPLEWFQLAEFYPATFDGMAESSTVVRWRRRNAMARTHEPWDLPAPIFDRLGGEMRGEVTRGRDFKLYPYITEAVVALWRAALAWYREPKPEKEFSFYSMGHVNAG